MLIGSVPPTDRHRRQGRTLRCERSSVRENGPPARIGILSRLYPAPPWIRIVDEKNILARKDEVIGGRAI
jgi:hypothetical protein